MLIAILEIADVKGGKLPAEQQVMATENRNGE